MTLKTVTAITNRRVVNSYSNIRTVMSIADSDAELPP